MNMIYCTAATLRAVLCFIDATNTPKIAYDDDSLIEPLINKVKDAVGDRDGSQPVTISFNHDEDDLKRQFSGVCTNIQDIFRMVSKF